jgi:RND superfamily putative drug exporter
LIFQDATSPACSVSSRGFLDAWAPVFFFAMIFAISMDYTVFLLSSAKEHWDRERDARKAMVGGLAHSGPRDQRRRGGDGGRLLYLRPVGPLPPAGSVAGWSPGPWTTGRCSRGSPTSAWPVWRR